MSAEECLHGVWLGGWCSECAAMMWDAFTLHGAAASVGIEHGMTTGEVLQAIIDQEGADVLGHVLKRVWFGSSSAYRALPTEQTYDDDGWPTSGITVERRADPSLDAGRNVC